MPKSKLQRYCMKQTFDSKHFLNPVILPSETANNISNYIKASNLKIKDLQNLFGFEQPQAIYNWRSGKDLPSIDNLVKLVDGNIASLSRLLKILKYTMKQLLLLILHNIKRKRRHA